MTERYYTHTDIYNTDEGKEDQTNKFYKNLTDLLSPDTIEDDCIVQYMPNMSTEEVKGALKQWVADQSLPGQLSIFSSFITNPVQIAEIYESMSYIPADNNCPLKQEFFSSNPKRRY